MSGARRHRPDPTSDYLARCAEDPQLLACVRDMQLPGAGAHYPKIALPRPIFVPRDDVVDLADDVLKVLDICQSIPDRCFNGDWDAYQAAHGRSRRDIALLKTGLTKSFVPLGRIDAFATRDTLKVMEVNVGSGIGGVGVAKLCRGLMRDSRFRAFADHHGLHYDDPLETIAREIRECGKEVAGTEDPRTVLVEDSDGATSQGRAVAEDLTRLGLDTIACSIDDLDRRDGKIIASGQHIVDVVIRFFVLDDLVFGRARPEQVEMLAHAHLDGRTALYLGLDSDVHSDKGSLALLYEPAVWAELTPPERTIVERRVPWTRIVRSGDHDVMDECVARREELVLKPVSGLHGHGVLLGSETAEQTWRSAMSEPHETYVVQERLRPAPEPVIDPDTGESEEWDANLGVYFGRHGYMGTWVRARRTADGGIIGMNDRTKPGCAFTY